MGMENGLTVADALALQDRNGYNDGMFGGNGAWVFFLFFLLAWGNGGLWGNNGGGNLGNQINNDFLYTNLRSDMNHGFDQVNANIRQTDDQIRGMQQGLCDGFYAQNTTMLQGFNSMGQQMCRESNNTNNIINQARFEAKECLNKFFKAMKDLFTVDVNTVGTYA